MRLMEGRRDWIRMGAEAFERTDVPLIIVDQDSCASAVVGDDQGLYYFVPWVAKLLGISADNAYIVFLGLLLLLGASISIGSFFLAFRSWQARVISVMGIALLTGIAWRCSETYVASFFAVAMIVPFFVLWDKTQQKLNWKMVFALALSGLIICYSNFVRYHAGSGVLLFLASWIFLNQKFALSNKLVCLLVLVFFSLLPVLHIKNMINKRDQFLLKATPLYHRQPNIHPFWHTIYIGLGYLQNPLGIKYGDTSGFEKALSVNPNAKYLSFEYEEILKRETFSFIANHPLFFVKTVAAKLIVLLMQFILFSNLGLVACYFLRPSLRFVAPFLLAALFYAFSGVLAIPRIPYVLGMVSIAAIFGITMICLGLERYYSMSRTPIQVFESDNIIFP